MLNGLLLVHTNQSTMLLVGYTMQSEKQQLQCAQKKQTSSSIQTTEDCPVP
jgi:hypothetical protein